VNATLIEFRDLSADVRHFLFESPQGDLVFTPGQFLSVSDTIEGRRITRAYSIASAPHGPRFELCLNRVKPGHMAPRLFELRPGDAIEIGKPAGHFVLRTPPSDSVMVATGTGIAPIRSLLEAHIEKLAACRVTLIFGARTEADLLYRDQFEALAARHPGFRFWPVLSRPAAGWSGRTGYVQRHVDDSIEDRRDVDVYVCGMKAMVNDVRGHLTELGFARERLVTEKYD
jgi:ferredoxin-NADP reductase